MTDLHENPVIGVLGGSGVYGMDGLVDAGGAMSVPPLAPLPTFCLVPWTAPAWPLRATAGP